MSLPVARRMSYSGTHANNFRALETSAQLVNISAGLAGPWTTICFFTGQVFNQGDKVVDGDDFVAAQVDNIVTKRSLVLR